METLSILAATIWSRVRNVTPRGLTWGLNQIVRDIREKFTNLMDFNFDGLRNTRAKNIRNNFQNEKMAIHQSILRQRVALTGCKEVVFLFEREI